MTHTQGAADSKKFYRSLRDKVDRSGWKAQVFARDKNKCCRCSKPAHVVHHVYHLAQMRDDVFRENRQLDPYRSRRELIRFLNLVIEKHTLDVGESLCSSCHKAEHYDDP